MPACTLLLRFCFLLFYFFSFMDNDARLAWRGACWQIGGSSASQGRRGWPPPPQRTVGACAWWVVKKKKRARTVGIALWGLVRDGMRMKRGSNQGGGREGYSSGRQDKD
ncbi:uncharacterized protein K452DRAFT_31177 [Aplosporella prunicola CBS 121167]|uniref:Secreted protein n=1 Tax=Aplosporella prunicola CBS 121167 TaxID=1176127 RepID=A0A6A6BE99_9PEZI|nr:uncharacterized protein K452DRAFT_31177 [Aplosporella prunicola CBS 121167]KAF2141625.1 hypothetical protein K452DRAFT_31177 [Aplosporella prunicola CBS 121167]